MTVENISEMQAWFAPGGIHAYAKGGLITHTGPAWLDGTKTDPESILSAVDTKNLIQLKDILGEILKGSLPQQTRGGDNYFEINVDVAELGSDYDVEQLIRKVKQEINDDARYRNVNTINILR